MDRLKTHFRATYGQKRKVASRDKKIARGKPALGLVYNARVSSRDTGQIGILEVFMTINFGLNILKLRQIHMHLMHSGWLQFILGTLILRLCILIRSRCYT